MENKYIKFVVILIPILLAAIALVQVVKNNNQAFMPVPREICFSGEYSYDGENWYPYSEKSDISALKGDVRLKGHFDAEIMEGAVLNFFCNHIGVSMFVNGELIFTDAQSEMTSHGMDLMPSMCGKRWEQLQCPVLTTEDEVEFQFTNFHKYGNQNAYQEVLASLMITPLDNTILEVYLKPYIEPLQMAGYALIIVAVMFLGASFSAIILKSNIGRTLFYMGMATLFAGGYMVFDIMMVYILDELLVIKTYGSQLCLMLAVYFVGLIICENIKSKRKNIAQVVMWISGSVNVLLSVWTISGKVLLYDTKLYWDISQLVICLVLSVLCILEMKSEKKSIIERVTYVTYVLVNLAVLLDISGAGSGMYYSGVWFKVFYVILLFIFLVDGAKQVVLDHQASIKNKKLKEELEQSRITVMLSQIQPHFLYNSLTSVMDLCDWDPKQAKSAIADFADYLRGNLASLRNENLISFETELRHIEKYLRLEKLRFREELEIVYDIQSKDFMLPALSVQPLVENAVKHGVGQKVGGGSVMIHTRETDTEYIICIKDNGVGFNTENTNEEDGESHVGIENTRKRLDMMLKARVEIESTKGIGTTACIMIPKRRDV